MFMVSSKSTFVKRLFISKEHIWSDEQGLIRRLSTKLKESFTQHLKNMLEIRLKIGIKNFDILYCKEFIISNMDLHGKPFYSSSEVHKV